MCAELLVRYKLDGGVGEDSQKRCAVTTEEAGIAGGFLDGGDGTEHAEGGTCVLCEGRGGGLKEDFYTIEGGY